MMLVVIDHSPIAMVEWKDLSRIIFFIKRGTYFIIDDFSENELALTAFT